MNRGKGADFHQGWEACASATKPDIWPQSIFLSSRTADLLATRVSPYKVPFIPGGNGDVFLAVPPEPGFLVANTFWYQSGNVGAAVLEGQVELNLDIDTFLNLTALT